MIVKVCGMREADNIRDVAQAGIDWMGMIFWPKSSRYVANPSAAEAIPDGITRVGVFVNQEPSHMAETARLSRLDIIQLHGTETPEDIAAIRSLAPDVKIMKAISIGHRDDLHNANNYAKVADYLLFDTKCKCVGGSGMQFDWTVLNDYKGPCPFLLSGGIGPGDFARLSTFRHDFLAGIDLNSRFETAPGLKDAAALKCFIKRIKSDDYE